jgi:hypothetical protein
VAIRAALVFTCLLLAWLILLPWRWRRHVSPKRRFQRTTRRYIPEDRALLSINSLQTWTALSSLRVIREYYTLQARVGVHQSFKSRSARKTPRDKRGCFRGLFKGIFSTYLASTVFFILEPGTPSYRIDIYLLLFLRDRTGFGFLIQLKAFLWICLESICAVLNSGKAETVADQIVWCQSCLGNRDANYIT